MNTQRPSQKHTLWLDSDLIPDPEAGIQFKPKLNANQIVPPPRPNHYGPRKIKPKK